MFLIHDDQNGKRQIWASVEDYGCGAIWEFHVYGLYASGDARTCPSLSMACDVLGVDPHPILYACPALGSAPLPVTQH